MPARPLNQPTRRAFLGLVGASGVLAACGGTGTGTAATTTQTTPTAGTTGTLASIVAAATRVVEVPGGAPVTVAALPSRIVALDNFAGVVFDLGATLVGRNEYLPPWKAGTPAFAGLPIVDDADYIADPEAIIGLTPDLILSTAYQVEGVTDALNQIAPVIAVPDDYTLDWRQFGRFTGQAIGIPADDRIAGIDARARAITLAGRTVSIVRPMGNGEFRLMGPGTFGGDLLTTAGAVVQLMDEDQYAQVSVERLEDVTSDVIMLWTDEAGVAAADIDAKIAEVEDNPLWATLPAVKAGAVHRVGEHWIGIDFQAADLVLDDIEQTLT